MRNTDLTVKYVYSAYRHGALTRPPRFFRTGSTASLPPMPKFFTDRAVSACERYRARLYPRRTMSPGRYPAIRALSAKDTAFLSRHTTGAFALFRTHELAVPKIMRLPGARPRLDPLNRSAAAFCAGSRGRARSCRAAARETSFSRPFSGGSA